MSWIADAIVEFVGQMAIFKGHDIGRRRAKNAMRPARDEYELVTMYPDELREEEKRAARASDEGPRS